MKKIFLCFKRAGITISKYLVFSLVFVSALFMSTVVKAAENGYSNYDYDGTEYDATYSKVDGVLKNECTHGTEYQILKGSHSGKDKTNSATSTDCVSYTVSDGTQYFYLQAQQSDKDDHNTWNEITFDIFDSQKHAYIIVAEYGFSKSDATKTDYDLFSLNADDTTYTYSQISCAGKTGCTAWTRNNTTAVGSAVRDATKYRFTYHLRDFSFGAHQIEVYFYSANSDEPTGTEGTPTLSQNRTANVEVKYILSKPLSEFKFNVDHNLETDDSPVNDCVVGNYEICLNYIAKVDTGVSNNEEKTNTFNISMSSHTAFYFSTLNSHKITGANKTVENIKKYNSIYATNTFLNEGETDTTKKVIFNYYNFMDNTNYGTMPTSVYPTKVNYAFALTIDASGTYRFYLTDIFGNHISPESSASMDPPGDESVEITDISNRDLTIFFLAYQNANTAPFAAADVQASIGNVVGSTIVNAGEEITDFQLPENAFDNITNKNITIGLEFYSTVRIKPDYAIQESTQGILSTPLYYENGGTTTNIRMHDNSNVSTTYFCRLKDANTINASNCVNTDDAASDKSNFKTQELVGVQEIYKTIFDDLGKNAVYNKFDNNSSAYYSSRLDDDARYNTGTHTLQSNNRNNRTQIIVNENGVYFIRIQDIYGNFKTASIKVSIIDQNRPIISLNGDESKGVNKTNNICSSMYVVGAGVGGTATNPQTPAIASYPEGRLENCSARDIEYNHFEDIETAGYQTEKSSTIRHTIIKGTNTVEITNGFYNMETNLVNFNYADAIRMGLVRVSDSMITFDQASIEKSVYEKIDSKYLTYKIQTLNRSNVLVGDSLDTTRISYGYQAPSGTNDYSTDLIISNNYTQYSSELKPTLVANKEYLTFKVNVKDASGNYVLVCQTSDNPENNQKCYDMVNAYIDKGMNFSLTFKAVDYAGNESLERTMEITVIDDTAPGIATLADPSDDGSITRLAMQAYPTIPKNNLDTTCRLEIGSKIQTKEQLLKCYGIMVSNTSYNIVDNTTSYFELGSHDHDHYIPTSFSGYDTTYTHTDRIYKYALDSQIYASIKTGDHSIFEDYLKVYVCLTSGANACPDDDDWSEVTDGNLVFDNAGSYKLKIEITDPSVTYQDNSKDQNKTTLIFTYYVNPRVLLVKPIAKTVTYGTYNKADLGLQYCVYATTNTNAFFYNLFRLDYDATAEYKDTYDFLDKNYESAGFGIVYCTSGNDGTDAVEKTNLKDVLASENAELQGNLNITYASGSNKYNMSMSGDAYYDAGYYYITMGNLKIGKKTDAPELEGGYAKNYVLRLHPAYLLEDATLNIKGPHDALANYDSATIKGEEKYKYGVSSQDSKGETVSNVLYVVEQAKLTVSAVGGSKTYGMPDTNYPQASDTRAITNVYNYKNESVTPNTTTPKSTWGYLNGYNIKGLVHNDNLDDESDMAAGLELKGFLRRQKGEEAGVYRICNTTDTITNALCSVPEGNFARRALTEETITAIYANVDKTVLATGDEIRYGMYVEYDGRMYKLTRDNATISGSSVTLKVYDTSDIWEFKEANGLDEKYLVNIIPNTNNGNKNYYLVYEDATYTINPGNVVVQPGSNQGKEYANPQKYDPMFEIIIYGESLDIVGSSYDAAYDTADDKPATLLFNGFTETITPLTYPIQRNWNEEPYTQTDGGSRNDNELYYTQKRTRTTDLYNADAFVYKFAPVGLDSDNTFGWMGTNYKYVSSNKVCLAVSNETQCYENAIQQYKFEYKAADATYPYGSIIMSVSGKLTYQNYSLLVATGISGEVSASITRSEPDNINVKWYDYVFDPDKMHVKVNGYTDTIVKCKVEKPDNKAYNYIIDPDAPGTETCGNYSLAWDDNAPKNTITSNKVSLSVTTQGVGESYAHNGSNTCDQDDIYTVSCGNDVKKIKFLIFKRDVIISFNDYTEVYGKTYEHYESNVFAVADVNTVPTFAAASTQSGQDLITCYEKKVDGKFEVAGKGKYDKILATQCNDSVYGIGIDDKWGSSSVNLRFFLSEVISTNFVSTTYPIPAGLYYVHATIGTLNASTNKWVHPNYNLVYLDYYIISAGESAASLPASDDGTIDITSRGVSLVGTYYQKEYGQGAYATYGTNGTALSSSNVGSGSYSATLPNAKTASTNWIFDNHYYHCDTNTSVTYTSVINAVSTSTTGLYMGCDASDVVEESDDANYGFGQIGNIFGYTISVVDGDANSGMIKLASGKADKISSNFYGTPYRPDLLDTDDSLDDPYGLLANVGHYTISLDNINEAVAQYKDASNNDIVFTGTAIKRAPNYEIKARSDGKLYITPASITVATAGSQTKMYGCAYNKFNVSAGTYTYENGYPTCVENNDVNYDLGYKYTVANDKYNYLMGSYDNTTDPSLPKLKYNTLADGTNALAVCSLENRRPDGTRCVDITYPSSTLYNYTVEPDFTTDSDDQAKPTNTALNEGTLFRAPKDGENKYDYKTNFDYAVLARKNDSTRVYQHQTVGDYIITIGDLDSKFNNSTGVVGKQGSESKMCNASSTPDASASGTYYCKNFIINYDGNNTALHAFEGTTHTFDSQVLVISSNDFKFTITERQVVMHTEYNYKIYGDTDPVEGFTCENLSDMFGLTNYDGRDYCSNDTTFIETGVSRYYAVDNSLAKAPWTGWTVSDSSSKPAYNDILFDVINHGTSRIYRETSATNKEEPERYDSGGQYKYIYDITTTGSINGSNYTIAYLSYVAGTGSDGKPSTLTTKTPAANNHVTGADVGFATVDGDKLVRWYGNNDATSEPHKCHSVYDNGGNAGATDCTKAYTGVETYRFYIDGITRLDTNPVSRYTIYTLGNGNTSIIQPEVYFEIIHREVYIQTVAWDKDYGTEENYNNFDVQLVTPKADGTGYEPITASTSWGDPSSLSKDDYDKFFPSGTFSQANFKGGNDPALYRGNIGANGTWARAFGIHFYRTYGETVGQYVIVACPTQSANDNTCVTHYQTIYNGAADKNNLATGQAYSNGDAAILASPVSNAKFMVTPSSNEYNASNYIVYTIPNLLTINKRQITITPDTDQGFQYGNYIADIKIDPITYKETYNNIITNDDDESGLVNGGILNSNDNVNNQIALCIYNIAGIVTCINDRQNTSVAATKFVATTLHGGNPENVLEVANRPTHQHRYVDTTATYNVINNVYNDQYNSDNDNDRFALDRVAVGYEGSGSQRYNRNVGKYTIVAGELKATDEKVCDASTTTNCLNANYDIIAFTEGVEYEITAAVLTVTPKEHADKTKTYGEADKEMSFNVITMFKYQDRVADQYYCAAAFGGNCQALTTYNAIGVIADSTITIDNGMETITISGNIVTIEGFAYSEDTMTSGSKENDYNYGIARVSNKSNTEHALTSAAYTSFTDKEAYPRYYDKYCRNNSGPTCVPYDGSDAAKRYASLTYGETSRILLGYFHVKHYEQNAADELTILNGMVVAQNEFNDVNYSYVYWNDTDEVYKPETIGRETTAVKAKINKLAIDATIKNITKVYGQATDLYKADNPNSEATDGTINYSDGTANHAVSLTSNKADNNENRLEYNFNVTGTPVNIVDGVVTLTQKIDGHYYTQTGAAETKNVHLGLSVVRSIKAGSTNCLVNIDIGADIDAFGCEDANKTGEYYSLVFRKVVVDGNVDNNYSITFGGSAIGSLTTGEGRYAYVAMAVDNSIVDESVKDGATYDYKYNVYSNSVSRDTSIKYDASGAPDLNIYESHEMKLIILPRKVQFHVGTWNPDGTTAERYVIEENEDVPEFPLLNVPFTTTTTTVPKQTTYYNTWFDLEEYVSTNDVDEDNVPRQVRIADNITTLMGKAGHSGDGKDATMGVGICSKAVVDVQTVAYNDANCRGSAPESGEGKFIYYSLANTIVGGEYVFNTANIGNYAILRNPAETYISNVDAVNVDSNSYETQNYVVDDVNGALVIYEDETPPTILVGNSTFAIEANAHRATCNSVTQGVNPTTNNGQSFSYDCTFTGKNISEYEKNNPTNIGDELGDIIKYITMNYSAYKGQASNINTIDDKDNFRLPDGAIGGTDWRGWTYLPVNNIYSKDTKLTTRYDVDRSINTYDFDEDYIGKDSDTYLRYNLIAVSSIISYFNVTSYDYGYVRNGRPGPKRYTPRYYFFIEGATEGSAFDPTIVGDSRVIIYAIDEVGNQSSVTVTLRIVDTTKPETGEMHLFNAPVKCTLDPCITDNISSWIIKPETYVPISAFAKYDENEDYDPVNGTWIVTSRTTTPTVQIVRKNITREVQRYSYNATTGTYYEDILGDYVYVDADDNIPATEIEHKYWYNEKGLYMVVVGGKDNSYVDSADTTSQWHTYYTVDEGENWYKYPRHSQTGVQITFEDGISQIHTRIIDSGRSVTISKNANGYTYYGNMFLRHGATCDGIVGLDPGETCKELEESGNVKTMEIFQVKNKQMALKDGTTDIYVFDVNASMVEYDSTNKTVDWATNPEDPIDVESTGGVFDYGILKCTIGPVTPGGEDVVNCQATYNLVYRSTDENKVDEIVYDVGDVGSDRNLNDWDEITFDSTDHNADRFYKDRRYIYIDTVRPELNALNGDPFSLYEYKEKCQAGVTDERCKQSYEEEFLTAKDSKVTTTAAATVIDTGAKTTLAIGNTSEVANKTIIFDGQTYYDESQIDLTESTYKSIQNKSSGLFTNGSTMFAGAEAYNDADGSADFNKNKMEIVVYLVASKGGATAGSVDYYYYKYIVLYVVDDDGNGKFEVSKQERSANDLYSVLPNYGSAPKLSAGNLETIEDALEYIVSTASLDSTLAGAYLDFNINYKFYDAAGNRSEFVANKSVRGVTYVKYESTVTFTAPNNTPAMASEGDNTYTMQVNQGVGLLDILSKFNISNVNYEGVNNVSGLRHTLYYNGEVLEEGVYNEGIMATIAHYAAKYPGRYTLKITSERLATLDNGQETVIYDKPLTINFDITPDVASVTGNNNFIIPIIAIISMISASFVLIVLKTVSKKRKEEI